MAANVLIVDNDPKVLKLVDRALSRKGYHTEATCSPRKALEIVKTKPCFDVLVTDVEMPEMSGPELVKKIECVSPSTAVVVMSGYASIPEIPPQTSFIRKPFSLHDLFAVVDHALERSRELQNSLNHALQLNFERAARNEELGRKVDEVARAIENNVRRLRENLGRDRDS